jgi:hypothetical protein
MWRERVRVEGRVLGKVRGYFVVGFGVEVLDHVEGGFGSSRSDFGFHPCLAVCGECASQYMYARPDNLNELTPSPAPSSFSGRF